MTSQPPTSPDQDLDRITADALSAIAAAADLDALDAVRQRFMGKKGVLSGVKRSLGQMESDQRRTVGQKVNEVNAAFGRADSSRRTELEIERDRVVLAAEAIDITLPPRVPPRGSLHPLRQTMDAILDVFVGLGYEVVTGPEVESDWFNFDALNTHMDHPARTLQDTIYVQGLSEAPPRDDGTTGLLLRTQTSPMQVRTMLERGGPNGDTPIYVAIPGRVYRQDTPDATHVPVFHQIEGLALDRDLSMADLYGTLMAFAKALVGPDVKLRFRPHYFPFTEPSAELDAWIPDSSIPDSQGGGQWVELLGSGMVHPNVLEAGGYDPDAIQGFAFGIGIERTAMVRYGVDDLRMFAENDVRLLSNF